MEPIVTGDRRIADIHRADCTPFVYPDGIALGQDFHVCRMPAGCASAATATTGTSSS